MTNKLSEKGLKVAAEYIQNAPAELTSYHKCSGSSRELAENAIQAYLENAWMPIEDAPKQGTRILACGVDQFGHTRVEVIYWNQRREKWMSLRFNTHGFPTHFQYITPPKVEKELKYVSPWDSPCGVNPDD